MADKHPSGNPELIDQHKKVRNEGDQELAGTDDKAQFFCMPNFHV